MYVATIRDTDVHRLDQSTSESYSSTLDDVDVCSLVSSAVTPCYRSMLGALGRVVR